METENLENGKSENRKTSFKEAEDPNSLEINEDPNSKQSIIQIYAAHSNKMNEKQTKVQVEKADENFDLMIRNAQNIDSRTKFLLEQERPLIRKIFPNKMDKLIAALERNTVQEALQFRLFLYKLNTQFMLEGMREKYNTALKMIKAEYRSQVAVFMMSKLESLSNDVKNRQYTFIQIVREKNQFLKTMADIPSTAERYALQIEREQDRYFNFLEQLVINFENILNEELRKFN